MLHLVIVSFKALVWPGSPCLQKGEEGLLKFSVIRSVDDQSDLEAIFQKAARDVIFAYVLLHS